MSFGRGALDVAAEARGEEGIERGFLQALKRRARRHHRSLQGELRELLEAVAREEHRNEPVPPLALRFSSAGPKTSWKREEIYGDDGR